MLLGYFLSSSQSDSISDVQTSTTTSDQLANRSASSNAEEFKNVLNDSLNNREKYLIKQTDTPYSESELLYAVQQWNKHYISPYLQDNQNKNNQSALISAARNNAASAQTTASQQVVSQYKVGDIMPSNGNTLPGQISITSSVEADHQSKAAVQTSDLTNKVINKIVEANNDNKNINVRNNNSEQSTIADLKLEAKAKSAVIIDKAANTGENQAKLSENNKSGPGNFEGKIIDTDIKSNKDPSVTSKIYQQILNKTVEVQPNQLKNTEIKNPSTVQLLNEPQEKHLQQRLTSQSGLAKSVDSVLQSASPLTNTATEKSGLITDANVDKAKPVTSTRQDLATQVVLSAAAEKNVGRPIDSSDKVTRSVDSSPVKQEVKLAGQLIENTKNSLSEAVKSANSVERNTNLLQAEVSSRVLNSPLMSAEAATSTSSTTSSQPVAETSNSQSQQFSNQQNAAQNPSVNKAADIALQVGIPAQRWNQRFAEHVSMLALRGTSNAQIRLDPPELGPMAIRINHTGTETHIQFMVTNPIARDLVDSSMNRLREMLEQHGFENVNVDVNEFKKGEENNSNIEFSELDIDEKLDEISNNSDQVSEKVKSNSLIDLFV